MLKFVVLVEEEGAIRFSRSVVLFQAMNFEDGFRRALDLGQSMERRYMGGTGRAIRIALYEVETIDMLGEEIVDGREIYSEPMEIDGIGSSVRFDAVLEPQHSRPTQSGV